MIQCLDQMYSLLTENDITKLAVVENFGALLASNEDISMFGSGDVDQYADPREQKAIYQVLQDHKYTLSDTKAGDILISSSIENQEVFPGINWDVTNRSNLPRYTAKGDFIDWEIIIRWAKRNNNRMKIATAAYLVHKLLDVGIPNAVFAIGNPKQIKKLLHVVYNEKENRLNDFPGTKERILVGIHSHDKSALHGAAAIVFPPYSWTKGKYKIGSLGI